MGMGKLIVGNWKMNGLVVDSRERAMQLVIAVKNQKPASFQMVLCPPATMIGSIAPLLKDSGVYLGGQDCHAQSSGAFTGDVSAAMLKDLECSYVILGHSERRALHNESSETVLAKAKAAHAAGLRAIICVGESESERMSGQAAKVISDQLKASIPASATPDNTVIAYEPVWAIGTGKTASAQDIQEMHALIRQQLAQQVIKGEKMPILYGGSVKASNASEILHIAHVDGVLVGGASLKADEFLAIAQASAAK